MKKKDNLTNHLLVAMPTLVDATFNQSVIYVYEHSHDGAIGVLINKPMQITLGNVLEHLGITVKFDEIITLPIFMGGPVGPEHGFIIYKEQDEPEQPIEVSASKEILKQIAKGGGPNDFIVTLGYSGWSGGQLEEEIIRNDWLVVPADPTILFETSIPNRWRKAAKLIGVDVDKLSSLKGHG